MSSRTRIDILVFLLIISAMIGVVVVTGIIIASIFSGSEKFFSTTVNRFVPLDQVDYSYPKTAEMNNKTEENVLGIQNIQSEPSEWASLKNSLPYRSMNVPVLYSTSDNYRVDNFQKIPDQWNNFEEGEKGNVSIPIVNFSNDVVYEGNSDTYGFFCEECEVINLQEKDILFLRFRDVSYTLMITKKVDTNIDLHVNNAVLNLSFI